MKQSEQRLIYSIATAFSVLIAMTIIMVNLPVGSATTAIIPVITWSWIFKVFLPRTPVIGHLAIADPYDIICYCLGGLIAGIIWRVYYKMSFE